MKKTIFLISLLAIIGLATVFSANAQEATSAPETTSLLTNSVDLGVENPGMLPTSPFYFLKEWRRGINKFFTFNPVKKAELELEEINQRAAEIKKLEEIAPQNIEAINRASSNYQKNAEQLKNRLEALKETSQNPNIDKLLDKLVDRSFKHQELFDNLEKKFEARQEISEQKRTELKEKFEANRERINEIMSKIPEKFEDANRFKQRLENAIENRAEGIFKELRAVEILDRVKEKLSEEQQEKIQEMKERMIEKFKNRIEKLDKNEQLRIFSPEVLESLPGDQTRRMEIFEEIKGRVNPEIREKINALRQIHREIRPDASEIQKEQIKPKPFLPTNIENEIKEFFRNRDLNQSKQIPSLDLGQACIQVITPAISSNGVCKNFPTSCDVPEGWKRVERCLASEEKPAILPTERWGLSPASP